MEIVGEREALSMRSSSSLKIYRRYVKEQIIEGQIARQFYFDA